MARNFDNRLKLLGAVAATIAIPVITVIVFVMGLFGYWHLNPPPTPAYPGYHNLGIFLLFVDSGAFIGFFAVLYFIWKVRLKILFPLFAITIMITHIGIIF